MNHDFITITMKPDQMERCINALIARADSYRLLAQECRDSGLKRTAKQWIETAEWYEGTANFLRAHRHAA